VHLLFNCDAKVRVYFESAKYFELFFQKIFIFHHHEELAESANAKQKRHKLLKFK